MYAPESDEDGGVGQIVFPAVNYRDTVGALHFTTKPRSKMLVDWPILIFHCVHQIASA